MADNVIIRKNNEARGAHTLTHCFGPVDDTIDLPNSTDGITVDLLDRLVSEMHPGSRVTGFEVVEERGLGKRVSTAGRVRLRLRYAPGPVALPEDIVLKMVLAEPGVPGVLYETEVQMYREVLPALDIPKLRCLGAAYQGRSERFVLLLEDLSAQRPFFPTSVDRPLTPDRVAALLAILAKLHARYWGSPHLDAMGGWLSSLLHGAQFDFLEAVTAPAIEELAESNTYRRDLLTRVGRTPRQLWDGVKTAHAYHARLFPHTLVHGDTGSHNSYHLADGTSGFLDWQLSARGNWAHDVHYIIVTALSIADRRGHERALIVHYLAELERNGVANVPEIAVAMQGYARAMIWGFTVGWLLCPERNYGMDIIATNLERLYAAMMDNDTLGLVEQARQELA